MRVQLSCAGIDHIAAECVSRAERHGEREDNADCVRVQTPAASSAAQAPRAASSLAMRPRRSPSEARSGSGLRPR